jgi:hypothetical protein
MYEDKKIVVVSIAGKKKEMECQIKPILKEKGLIDKFIIFANTNQEAELEWFQELKDAHPDFIEIESPDFEFDPNSPSAAGNIRQFSRLLKDEDAIYIRVDQDVIWFSENFFYDFAKVSYENSDHPIIFPYVFNNSIMDHYLQQQGFYAELPEFKKVLLDDNSWNSGPVAEKKHRYLLDFIIPNVGILKPFKKIIQSDYTRISVNCFSIKNYVPKDGEVPVDEETFFAEKLPEMLNTHLMVSGPMFCIHYSYHTQRHHLETTNILNEYKSLILKKSARETSELIKTLTKELEEMQIKLKEMGS